MKIVTWNVNSVRLRLAHLARLAEELRPDVIALQETKAHDDVFPLAALQAAGYPYIVSSGMKSYNGVALLSRRPLIRREGQVWCGKSDCRHIAAVLENGIEVHNFYVPAGGDIPDRTLNPKFAHKLDFLHSLSVWFATLPPAPRILLGDLNVAPLPEDVWSHKVMSKIISHTPVEVAALTQLQESGAWVDAVRTLIPAPAPLFTWWSYRAADWEASNRGLRLDHIWLSPDLAPALTSGGVLMDMRRRERPSDHAPVWVELNLAARHAAAAISTSASG